MKAQLRLFPEQLTLRPFRSVLLIFGQHTQRGQSEDVGGGGSCSTMIVGCGT